MRRLPSTARLRRRRRPGVYPLPWAEDDPRGGRYTRTCNLHELPHPPRPDRRGRLVRGVPRHRARLARNEGSVRRLPRAARRGLASRRRGLHELPHERRRVRHGCACRRRGVRRVPQAARIRAAGPEIAMRDMPRTRNLSCRDQRRPPGLRLVPWTFPRARPRQRSRVRDLPCPRASQRAERTPEMPRVSRSARRTPDSGLRHLPQERSQRPTRVGPGRLRDVSPPPRTERRRGAAGVHHVPCALELARAPCRGRTCGLHELPRRAARAPARRPHHLHRHLPHRQARSSAPDDRMQRMPRVPAIETRQPTVPTR